MSMAEGNAEQEPDWLLETLQSAVHHARRDRSEETLMRLAQDSLLLSEYFRRHEDVRDACQPASATATAHRIALDIPGSARHGPGKDTSRYKLDSFLQARMTPGSAFSPEAFVADDDDRRLALDAAPLELMPAPQPSVSANWMRHAVVGGLLLLILLLALTAVI